MARTGSECWYAQPFLQFQLGVTHTHTLTLEFLSTEIIKSITPCTYYLIGWISISILKKSFKNASDLNKINQNGLSFFNQDIQLFVQLVLLPYLS